MINDRRRFTRVFFESYARISSDSDIWSTQVIDLSLKGALVKRPSEYKPVKDDSLLLEIVLVPETSILMDCRLVYATDETMGLECKQIDLESMVHLKRLIELNSEDSDFLLSRDLNNLTDNSGEDAT